MFNAYEFTFAGESSVMYGLMVYDFDGNGQENVSFGNRASLVEARTNNRIQPVHYGVNYHDRPLTFKLVFGSDRELDRYELESISMWLTGYQDYQWMTIDQPDLEHVQFRCLITTLTPMTHGWLPYAFEATVLCDCPYAYGYPFEQSYRIAGSTRALFRNDSSVREYLKPTLTFLPDSGVTELSIVNKSDGGYTFRLAGLPASCVSVWVDNEKGVIQETSMGYNLYGGFNLNFLRLVQGDNELIITGDGIVSLSGRFLFNVAG